ncbi:MAG TPA: intradiol ring-cleavage dioxygenase [Actinomycetota bacterium]|nr:intradiol ring-cleavage dioxygenase [Actinomycetota bacterium]
MPDSSDRPITRRAFLLAAGAAFAGAVMQACRGSRTGTVSEAPTGGGTPAGAGAPAALPPTPACGDDEAEATLAQTEGPYFTPNSPERANFRSDAGGGTPLVLTGTVLRTDCTPVERALVDVWHADARGEYDNEGYRLRGHFFSDSDGRYRLESIVPGLYPGRTRHLHVKVQAPRGRVLTTQLYFPDEPSNSRDGIFRPELNMAVRQMDGTSEAQFDFVLEA